MRYKNLFLLALVALTYLLQNCSTKKLKFEASAVVMFNDVSDSSFLFDSETETPRNTEFSELAYLSDIILFLRSKYPEDFSSLKDVENKFKNNFEALNSGGDSNPQEASAYAKFSSEILGNLILEADGRQWKYNVENPEKIDGLVYLFNTYIDKPTVLKLFNSYLDKASINKESIKKLKEPKKSIELKLQLIDDELYNIIISSDADIEANLLFRLKNKLQDRLYLISKADVEDSIRKSIKDSVAILFFNDYFQFNKSAKQTLIDSLSSKVEEEDSELIELQKKLLNNPGDQQVQNKYFSRTYIIEDSVKRLVSSCIEYGLDCPILTKHFYGNKEFPVVPLTAFLEKYKDFFPTGSTVGTQTFDNALNQVGDTVFSQKMRSGNLRLKINFESSNRSNRSFRELEFAIENSFYATIKTQLQSAIYKKENLQIKTREKLEDFLSLNLGPTVSNEKLTRVGFACRQLINWILNKDNNFKHWIRSYDTWYAAKTAANFPENFFSGRYRPNSTKPYLVALKALDEGTAYNTVENTYINSDECRNSGLTETNLTYNHPDHKGNLTLTKLNHLDDYHYYLRIANVECLVNNKKYEEASRFINNKLIQFIKNGTDILASSADLNDKIIPRSDFLVRAFQVKPVVINKEINENPFDPFLVARISPEAYVENLVLDIVKNYIDWGDLLYFNATDKRPVDYDMALKKYEIAEQILKRFLKRQSDDPKGLIVKTTVQDFLQDKNEVVLLIPPQTMHNIYFDFYRNKIHRQIEKLNNYLNFNGSERTSLAYLDPNNPYANPTFLDAIRNMNKDLADPVHTIISPEYRFSYLIDLALQEANAADELEAKLLRAIEQSSDKEEALLRAKEALAIQEEQIKIGEIGVIHAQNEITEQIEQYNRVKEQQGYYNRLLTNGLNTNEKAALGSQYAAIQASYGAVAVEIANAARSWIPLVGGGGGNPMSALANAFNQQASSFLTLASFDRRREEWEFQRDLLNRDISIANINITQSELQLETSKRQLKINTLQYQFSDSYLQFLYARFDKKEFYDWMKIRLEELHNERLMNAISLVKSAELALKYEFIGEDDIQNEVFLKPEKILNGQFKNITSAIKIKDVCERMKKAYASKIKDLNEDSYTISLRKENPIAFYTFIEKRVTEFTTELDWFDRHIPGDYLRRIKSIDLEVDAIVGAGDDPRVELSSFGYSKIMLPPFSNDALMVVQSNPFQGQKSQRFSVNFKKAKNADDLDARKGNITYSFTEGLGVDNHWQLKLISLGDLEPKNITDIRIKITYTYKRSEQYLNQLIQKKFGGIDENGNISQGEVRYLPLKAEFNWSGVNDTSIVIDKSTFNQAGLDHKIKKIGLIAVYKRRDFQKGLVKLSFVPDEPGNKQKEIPLELSKNINESYEFFGKSPYGTYAIKNLKNSGIALSDLQELFLVIEYTAKYKTSISLKR